MAELSDARWDELSRDLSARMAAFAPDWTEPTGHDPGLTLVELIGFLAESLMSRADLSPRARTRLGEIQTQRDRAAGSDCRDETLTRNRYFTGRMLTAGDLAQEQAYERTKHRRHNRLVHGVGIVRGLAVTLEPRAGGGDPLFAVAPGVALDPTGEEVVVCEPTTGDVCQGASVCYVTLALVERPTNPTPAGESSSVEESAGVAVSEDVPPGHLPIARLLREGGTWRIDPGFEAARI